MKWIRMLGCRSTPRMMILAAGLGITIVTVVSLLTWQAWAAAPLADTPWPTYGQNVLRNGRSPYQGPQQAPNLRWRFTRNADHWGTDYRGTGIGSGNTVYLSAGMAGVYAMDSGSGQMKWIFSPESTGHETWVEFPPTVSADGKLYITSENDYLYALDATGKVLWKFLSNHLHTPVSISPDGSTIHFASENGHAYALNRADGTLKWSYELSPYSSYGTGRRIPVVYDPSGNLYFIWVDTVWSLTPNGAKLWSLRIPGRSAYAVGPAVSDDGTLYFTAGDSIVAVTMSGQLKWQQLLGSSAFDRTPAIGPDGTVYIGTDGGVVWAFNPNGTVKWKQRYVMATGWGCGVKSNLLLDSAGTLYFYGKDGYVYAVNSQTRQVLWKYNSVQVDNSYPGIQLSLDDDGTLYVPVDEKMLLALASTTPAQTPTPTATQTDSPPATATSTSTPTPTQAPPSSGNLVVNGSFEDDNDGDGVPDSWMVTSPGVGLVSRSENQHYDGSYSLRANSTQGQSIVVYQDLVAKPGQVYSFSGRMNVPTSSGWFRASAQLLAMSSPDRTLTTVTARALSSTTSGWVPAQTSITMPANTTTLRVQLKLEYLKADVYADAFTLTRTK